MDEANANENLRPNDLRAATKIVALTVAIFRGVPVGAELESRSERMMSQYRPYAGPSQEANARDWPVLSNDGY